MKSAEETGRRRRQRLDFHTPVESSPAEHPPSAAPGGFTLIELVVVIAILGLAMGLLAPDLRRSLDALRYRAAARELAATLRYARSLAVYTKETQVVAIDSEGGSYRLRAMSERADGEAEPAEAARVSEAPQPGGRLPPGMTVELVEGGSVSRDDGFIMVSFYPKGSSSGAGLVLSGGKKRYGLEVDAVTGSVKISSLER